MQQLEQDRREFELRLFQIEQGIQDRADKTNFRITLVLGFLAFAEVAAAIISIAIALGWIG